MVELEQQPEPESLPPGASRHTPSTERSERATPALDDLLQAAERLGFVGLGVAPVSELSEARERWQAWLAKGHHGAMAYLEQGQRASPGSLLPQARSAVCVALPYAENRELVQLRLPAAATLDAAHDGQAAAALDTARDGQARGSVAGYAQGGDYHAVLWRKLLSLADCLADLVGQPVLARPCVDTAPLLERALAARSGLGFIGKNGLLITPGLGSYLLLGELLVDVDLPHGEAGRDRCGECRACLDVCPTGAFRGPRDLDARRCIAYLTIELRTAIPRELRPLIGQRVFGCDACQSVCPFNSVPATSRAGSAEELASQHQTLELQELLELRSGAYKRLTRASALRRVSRAQLARNAAVALGNLGDLRQVPGLVRAATSHPQALVREHAAWALGRLGGEEAAACLGRLASADSDAAVRDEATQSLTELRQAGVSARNP